MSLPTVLRAEAQGEFDEAFDWYEGKRQGLGEEFAECVQNAVDRISRTPELHAVVYKNVRRGMVRRFPYSILYQLESAQVVVLAVFHSRRDPSIWQARV